MNRNPGNGNEEVSAGWVKRQLGAISAVEPPQSLRDRLLAGIPATAAGPSATRRVPAWSGWARWASAAAAVVVTASVIVWLGLSSGGPSRPIADINGESSQTYAADHNSLRPSDTNLCDINGLR